MIDHLTAEALDALIARNDPPCVSIFEPMEKRGAETQQNPLIAKGALKSATERLLEKGMRRPDAESHMAPLRQLIDDHGFWQQQEDGLAVFVDGTGMSAFRLPIPFEQLVVVGDHFHIKPVLPFLATDGEFYVLALSHNLVRLLRGSHWRVSEVELEDVPTSLRDALWYKEPDAALQSHATAAGGALSFHGHGLGEESSEADLKEFFRRVDAGVKSAVGNDKTPVILAGVDYLQPLYRQITDLNVLEEGVEGNPDRLSAAELHSRAWPIVDKLFTGRREAAGEQIGAANTSSSLDDVVMGAAQGRVETLFIPRGKQRWGRFDRETLEVHLDGGAGETDLYDLAAIETWRHRGDVYVVDDVPGDGELAAVMRY